MRVTHLEVIEKRLPVIRLIKPRGV
jgi:hypothetical protein